MIYVQCILIVKSLVSKLHMSIFEFFEVYFWDKVEHYRSGFFLEAFKLFSEIVWNIINYMVWTKVILAYCD